MSRETDYQAIIAELQRQIAQRDAYIAQFQRENNELLAAVPNSYTEERTQELREYLTSTSREDVDYIFQRVANPRARRSPPPAPLLPVRNPG